MDEVAEKAREDTLLPEEHSEMENFIRVGHFLSLLKSKARVSLKGSA